ncbi:MAG: hypothetical protein JNM17_18535 [Archangium sp.]|nr:hypothetical protein [Archangium sp.]
MRQKRLLLVLTAGVLLTAVAWGPTTLARLALSQAVPGDGALPRRIPYRGYIESSGTPVNDPTLPMRFRLYGADGGVIHEEARPGVVVQAGNFSVELGTVTPIDPAVWAEASVDLEVAIGLPPVPLSGRQRVLTVPYAQRARLALRSQGDVPVGAVIDWWRPSGSMLAIPSGFEVCDGHVVTDAESPFDGVAVPDLTSKFVMGVAIADIGTTGGADIHAHTISFDGNHNHTQTGGSGILGGGGPYRPAEQGFGTSFNGNHNHGGVVGDASSLPPYFGLLKIIRVK